MFVFLSHCVRKGDPAKWFEEKDRLISSLESYGHTVFDYAERPGGELNWVSEIRMQLHACDVLVYFAKKWPETKPGVCVLELSAAKMWSKPVVFFRPSRLGGFNGQRIFGKAFGGLSDSVHVGQDLVHFEISPLVRCLAAISASRPASQLSLSMESLEDMFLRTRDHFWPNRITASGLRPRRLHGDAPFPRPSPAGPGSSAVDGPGVLRIRRRPSSARVGGTALARHRGRPNLGAREEAPLMLLAGVLQHCSGQPRPAGCSVAAASP